MEAQNVDTADAGTVLRAIVHGGLLVASAFLVGSILPAVGGLFLRAAGLSVVPPSPAVTAVLTALQFVGFLLVGAWYVEIVADRDLLHLARPTLGHAGWVVVGFVALFVLNFLVSLVLSAIGVEPAPNRVIVENRDQPVAFLYLAVVSIFFVGPGEELLFRGLVQGLFRRAAGLVPGIAVASAAFGLVHVVALFSVPGTDPSLAAVGAYVVIAGLLGVVLGAIYERTKSLLVPIVIHGLWNTYQFLAVYADETGLLAANL